MATSMQIVAKYGTMWARNPTNINQIPHGSNGIYILFDGSMPVYVGKGSIKSRIRKARRSKRKGQLWDRFSWYALADKRMMHDLEMLLLKALPPYLRALTQQDGHFFKAHRHAPDKMDKKPEDITRYWSYRKRP